MNDVTHRFKASLIQRSADDAWHLIQIYNLKCIQGILVFRIHGLLLNTINIRLNSLIRSCVCFVLLFVNVKHAYNIQKGNVSLAGT